MESACEVRLGRSRDGRAEIFLSGELDLSGDAVLGQAIERARRDGATVVVVDASGLDFVDSNGLGVLIRARSALQADLGHLTVRGVTDPVRRVFELAGLDELLDPADG